MTNTKDQLDLAIKDTKPAQAELTSVRDDLEEFVIEDEIDETFALDVAHEAKSRASAIEKKRKEWVAPLNAVVKDINATFKPVVDGWRAVEKQMKANIVEYRQRLEAEKNKLLDDAALVDNSNQRMSLISEAREIEPQALKGAQIRRVKKLHIEDEAALIAQLVSLGGIHLVLDRESLKRGLLNGQDFGSLAYLVEEESLALRK